MYIASRNRSKFHHPDCFYAPYILRSQRRVEFATYEAAVAAGYKPCHTCHDAKGNKRLKRPTRPIREISRRGRRNPWDREIEHQRKAAVHRQGGKCMYCGIALDDHFELDHRLPRARGGPFTDDNLQAFCGRCNRRKSMQTDAEFRERYAKVLPSTLPPAAPIPQSRFDNASRRTRVAPEVREAKKALKLARSERLARMKRPARIEPVPPRQGLWSAAWDAVSRWFRTEPTPDYPCPFSPA